MRLFTTPGRLRERLQDQELGDGERDRLVLPGAGVALRVHAQLAALEHLGGVGLLRRACRPSGAARRSTALTRSTSSRCENGLRMKSSAPILRPNSSSISSSLEVRKITGMSVFWRSRRSSLHAVHARHLDVEDGEVRRRGLEAVERGGAVGIGHDPVAFGLERDRDRGQDVAVVVDERDGRHEPLFP